MSGNNYLTSVKYWWDIAIRWRHNFIELFPISELLQKFPADLAMNHADQFRNIQEKRYIIDRTIPFLDYGKGC